MSLESSLEPPELLGWELPGGCAGTVCPPLAGELALGEGVAPGARCTQDPPLTPRLICDAAGAGNCFWGALSCNGCCVSGSELLLNLGAIDGVRDSSVSPP